jgi:hypothetical protein
LAILDTTVLGYIFRVLHRYGYIVLPETGDPDYDPAVRAAAEFLQLQSQTRLLIEQLQSEGQIDREGLKREVAKRLVGQGPQ